MNLPVSQFVAHLSSTSAAVRHETARGTRNDRRHHGGTFLLAAALLVLLVVQLSAQNPGDAIFSGTQVHTIKFTFPRSDYWDSLKVYYDAGNEQCIMAQVEIDGVTYDSVGVRFKGNSSYTYPNNKKPFKLEFDYFGSSNKCDGEKSLHLNNMWGDPSFMREKIMLDFCRDNGIAAPRANFAELYINGAPWGFYSLVEAIDKRFLKTHYGESSGDYFKAVDAFDPTGPPGTQVYSDLRWYGPMDTSYYVHYENKTEDSPTSWPHLISLIDTLNNTSNVASTLPAKLNIDTYTKSLAADILFANLDAYINSGRNFYLYFNSKTSIAEWIVWDVGLSFGSYSAGVSKVETMSVTYVSNPDARPLAGKIYSAPALRSAYLLQLCSLFNQSFVPARMFAHIDSVANIIRPHVTADPRKMYTTLQFESNITSDVNAPGGAGARKPGLKSFITTREASVRSQLATLGITCVTDVESASAAGAKDFVLFQNYPNPFTNRTSVSFHLEKAAPVRVELTSLLGEHVATIADGWHAAGDHIVPFDAAHLPRGVYMCTMTVGSATTIRSLVCTR